MRRKRRRYQPPRGPRPATDWEKMKAGKLAERYQVPVTEVLKVIRGEIGLDEVLREQEARQKADELVKDGLHPQLAGQVARGKLDLEAAKVRSQLLEIQGRSFRYSRLNNYGQGDEIALYLFGYGLVTGRVVDNAPYDMDLVTGHDNKAVMVKKHDIKMFFPVDLADRVIEQVKKDDAIARLELGATVDLSDRYRPVPEEALAWLTMPLPVKFVMRDGDMVSGRVKRASVFEIDVELQPGLHTTVMTHALLKQQTPSFVMND